MKKIIVLFLFLVVVIVGVLFWQNGNIAKNDDASQMAGDDVAVIGLLTGYGGLGDRAFNDMQYKGMVDARRKYGIEFHYLAPEQGDNLALMIEKLIHLGCSMVICGEGYVAESPVMQMASRYPEIKFVVLDYELPEFLPNIASVSFKQNEGSFLAGALAAMTTKSKSVGMIGGEPIEVILDFYKGFEVGAKYIDESVNVDVEYLSEHDSKDVWADPLTGEKVAKKMIADEKSDILYGVAAASNLGIFHACKAQNCYAIGVDTDQGHLAPGTVLTSMMKRLDNAIVDIIGKFLHGEFENRHYHYGLPNGVSLAPLRYGEGNVPAEISETLRRIQKQIEAGELQVPSQFNGAE